MINVLPAPAGMGALAGFLVAGFFAAGVLGAACAEARFGAAAVVFFTAGFSTADAPVVVAGATLSIAALMRISLPPRARPRKIPVRYPRESGSCGCRHRTTAAKSRTAPGYGAPPCGRAK